METKELAKQLGISHQMANRYKRRGMPTDSLEAAIAWYKSSINPFRSKSGRIDGNTGLKLGTVKKKEVSSDTLITNSITETLTNIVPQLWFGQIGWLGGALRDHGVKITAEQLVKVQAILFYTYMSEVEEFLKTDAEIKFNLPDSLMARPGDQTYSSMMKQLTRILNKEPVQLYES